MPKTPSNKLFQLIKSLTGSEKRYFKLFVRNSSEKTNKYIQLFEAIEAQSVFDDDFLRQTIYPNETIQSRKYSELKAYLYELILKSLQGYDEKTSVEYKLQNALQSIKVLYKRALFSDCKELLGKARKLADKYEQFNFSLRLLNWEKQIAYAETNIQYLDQHLPRIEQAETDIQKKIENQTIYHNIFLKLLVSLRKDASLRAPEQRDRLLSLLNHPELDQFDKALSHQAKILYHRIYSLYYYSISDFQSFYNTGELLVEIIESKPHFLKESVRDYISTLSNLLVACILSQNYKQADFYLDKLKNIKPLTVDDVLKVHRQYYTVKFRLCINTGTFDEGLVALDEHFKKLKQLSLDKKLFETDSFYFQYFYIYFGTGIYDQALEYLNRWLNSPRSIERQDLQSLARILNLIIHYEMGNNLLLDSLLRSTYRFLNKRKSLFVIESKIIGFIRDSNNFVNRKELRTALIKLKEEVVSLSQEQGEKAMLQLFDLEAWLDSKIQNRTFAEIVKQKYLEKQLNDRV